MLCLLSPFIDSYTCFAIIAVKSSQMVEDQSNKNSGTDSSNASVIANAILAVLLVVSVVCVIALAVFVFKLKIQLQATDNNDK